MAGCYTSSTTVGASLV